MDTANRLPQQRLLDVNQIAAIAAQDIHSFNHPHGGRNNQPGRILYELPLSPVKGEGHGCPRLGTEAPGRITLVYGNLKQARARNQRYHSTSLRFAIATHAPPYFD